MARRESAGGCRGYSHGHGLGNRVRNYAWTHKRQGTPQTSHRIMLHEAAATVTSTSDFTATANIPIKGRFFGYFHIVY